MKTVFTTAPLIFLTDYASYNNGTQFEFGHWVTLSEFSDADEFLEYIKEHFERADNESPLDSPREEIMFTDFEGFPSCLYSESMSKTELENLFEWINLDECDKPKVMFLLEQGQGFQRSINHYEDLFMAEDNGMSTYYELFDIYYPDAERAERLCPYLEINYERFIRENFENFEYDGTRYLVSNDWNY